MDILNDYNGIPDPDTFQAVKRMLHPGMLGKRKKGFSSKKAERTKFVILRGANIKNLDFLKFFPNVKTLIIHSDSLSDLSGLRYAPGITHTDLSSCWPGRVDVGPIGACGNLEMLELCANDPAIRRGERKVDLRGFEAIGQMENLPYLALPSLGIKDISWISGLKKLRDAELSGNPIEDVSPLGKLTDLPEVDLCGCGLTDISPLSGMAGLEILYLGGNRVQDFSPLLQCEKLNCLSAEENGLSEGEKEKWRQAFRHVKDCNF